MYVESGYHFSFILIFSALAVLLPDEDLFVASAKWVFDNYSLLRPTDTFLRRLSSKYISVGILQVERTEHSQGACGIGGPDEESGRQHDPTIVHRLEHSPNRSLPTCAWWLASSKLKEARVHLCPTSNCCSSLTPCKRR